MRKSVKFTSNKMNDYLVCIEKLSPLGKDKIENIKLPDIDYIYDDEGNKYKKHKVLGTWSIYKRCK